MSLHGELYASAEACAAALADLRVAAVTIPVPDPGPAREVQFGMVELTGGACGLYYAWLDGDQRAMPAQFAGEDFAAMPALALARRVLERDDGARSLGIAAINAITEQLYRSAGFVPALAADAFGGLSLETGDRLGMIGYFPSLVRRARAQGVEVHVVERKAHLERREHGLLVTLDPACLRDCNKILCTGTTLLNDSLDSMLPFCAHAAQLALVGPTAGFFPDALFARGIHSVGGSRIVDGSAARARLEAGLKLGDSAVRTVIRRDDYPGVTSLLAQAQRGL